MENTKNNVLDIAINAEISGLDEAIKNNNLLIERLDETHKMLEDSAISIIDTMGLAFEAKSESIEKIRSWRKTIITETTQAINAINATTSLITPKKLEQLRDFVELLEKLNKLENNELIDKLLK